MKYYRILFLAAALTGLASCAVDPIKEYQVEKPQSIAEYEYLNDYDVLKNYVSSAASPDFKLGAAIAGSDFEAHGQVYALAVSNFNELTPVSEMNHASVVGNDGTMSVDAVRNYVNNAADAGMTVYGRNLVSHAQQNNKFLTSLIKDKELDIDPDAKIEVLDYEHNYATSGYPFWHQINDEVAATSTIGVNNAEGCLEIASTVAASQNYFVQYHIGDNLPVATGKEYILKVMIKGSAEGTLAVGVGPWSGRAEGKLNFTTEWQELSMKFTGVADGGHVMAQSGSFVGTIQIKHVKIFHLESPAVEVEKEVNTISYTDGPFPFYAMGCEPPIVGGYMHYEPNGGWNQFFIMPGANNPLTEGDHVVYLTMKANVDVASGVQLTMQNGWGSSDQNITAGVSVKAGEHEYRLPFNELVGGNYDMILKPQTADVILDVKGVRVCKVEKLNSIPLTPEEKKDTLTWAMNNWVKGMMEVTAEKVVAWDVVTEPLSNVDADGDGNYDLRSAENGDASANFYWADYLGSDYVATVAKMARDYNKEFGGAGLKLFVNESGLEDAKKVSSLINWIGKWEAAGQTIDGIAVQMNVKFNEDATAQKANETAVVNMFKALAASKKLVKVATLDVTYVDANGSAVAVTALTEAKLQAMASYYNYIVAQYLANVPAAQQYGITLASVVDGGNAISLWNANYSRNHAYAGFAQGLGGTASAE